MGNENLGKAKRAKQDEFYTQYEDIQNEVNAYYAYNHDMFRGKTILCPCDDPEWSNFTLFFVRNFNYYGLKKLISTSYAYNSKRIKDGFQLSLFEENSPQYDPKKTKSKGKIFVMESTDGKEVDNTEESLKWQYLEGDGDFNSDEVRKLRDEADFVITNPPFSLFRDFVAWIMEAEKKFLIIGHQNAITYKEVFPLIKDNKVWLGNGFKGGATHFYSHYKDVATAGNHKEGMIRVSGVVWFTNIEHGRRHEHINFMTMNDNLAYSKHKEITENGYCKYVNYDAIEVPYSDAIPSDYDGVMGVPISFLEKYCPEQFEIVGTDSPYYIEELGIGKIGDEWINTYKAAGGTGHITANMHSLCYYDKRGMAVSTYKRILIRKK